MSERASGQAARAPTDAAPRLPASCLPDFTATLEAPAGKHGFLTVGKDGRFRWPDGARARFWGINVSSTRLDIPHEQIEQVVQGFARAGLNLVRLEAIDNRNCLLGSTDAPDSRHFDPEYLDRLDYWMDALRRHGLYYYLDLLDFRTFKDGDGVLNADKLDRGARPYALFDRYLIALQKEYATQLLTHQNPYSGLRPVDDPALALVEICNEHGFFLYPEKLESLAEPYRSDLRARWNAWLRGRYGTRESLAAAWGTIGTFSMLRPDEDPAQQSVDLPLLTPASIPNSPAQGDVRRAPARLRDGVEFLVGLQRAYFREMRAHLRALGLRVPVAAVVSNDILPDVAAAAQEGDFTAENWYGEGIDGDPRWPDLHFYSNRNSLRGDGRGGFAPYTAALRWNHKPVVVREWAITWPNRFRAASVPEALAYSALQDYDAVLLFGYQTNRAPNGAEADALNDFAFQCDPTVWGLYALAGQAFLRGAIRPAERTVTLTYPDSRLFTWPNLTGDLYRAAWCVRLQSLTEDVPPQDSDGFQYTPNGNGRDLSALRALLGDLMPPNGDVPQRGKGNRRRRSGAAGGVWRSDTGQIVRYSREGRLEVRTPTLRLLAGELTPGHVYFLGAGVRFATPTTYGALLAFALDGRPLERSRHLVVKMVSLAENTGQVFEKAPSGAPEAWALRARGAAPVVTLGRPSAQPTRLWLTSTAASSPALALWMVNGTWELEIQDGCARLACDTPGIQSRLSLPGGELVSPSRRPAAESRRP
ncbi:MAG TPA: hypothetical protein VFB38_13890 [Chthonomonadaceae bacterium]|nr:hypothetical protein [Chthonomonadaceae bacterium]